MAPFNLAHPVYLSGSATDRREIFRDGRGCRAVSQTLLLPLLVAISLSI